MNRLYKHILFTFFFIFFLQIYFAQRSKRSNSEFNEKYFISVAFGSGEASWDSRLKNSALYDTSGAELFSGELLFTARNTLKNLTIDVAAQVNTVRLGLGLSFEEFYIEKIRVNNNNYPFSERFNFSKLFACIEVPFNSISGNKFSFSLKSSIGYYGFYNINRYNFFGFGNGGNKYFFNLGILADYRLFNYTYLFLQPMAEYKYFSNSKNEDPSQITHNIWSYFLMLGLRVDVSKI